MMLASSSSGRRRGAAEGVLDYATRGRLTVAIATVLWCSVNVGFLMGTVDGIGESLLVMPSFLRAFFPASWKTLRYPQRGMVQPTSMWWCSDSLPTSTAWIPGVSCGATVVGTWVSAWMCRAHGRRASIWAGNCVILAALLLLASAFGMPQLAVGDVLLGLGVGLIYQAALLEDAEVAPPRHRGTMVALIDVAYAAGYVLLLGIAEYAPLAHAQHGWRLLMTVPGWATVAMLAMLCFLPETPSSLIQRGFLTEGRESLRRIRGEFASEAALTQEALDIWQAAGCPTHGCRPKVQSLPQQVRLMCARERRPQLLVVLSLTVAVWLPDALWQVAAETPLLLHDVFVGDAASVQAEAVLAAVSLVGTAAAACLLDTALGRRGVLAIGAVAGMVAEAALAVLLSLPGDPSKAVQIALAVLLSLRDAKVAFYWPPMTATFTEHFPLCCRSIMLATVLTVAYGLDALTWTVLSRVMCTLKWGNLVWMAACDAAVLAISWALLPEAKGQPLETMERQWRAHRVWRKYYARIGSSCSSSNNADASRRSNCGAEAEDGWPAAETADDDAGGRAAVAAAGRGKQEAADDDERPP